MHQKFRTHQNINQQRNQPTDGTSTIFCRKQSEMSVVRRVWLRICKECDFLFFIFFLPVLCCGDAAFNLLCNSFVPAHFLGENLNWCRCRLERCCSLGNALIKCAASFLCALFFFSFIPYQAVYAVCLSVCLSIGHIKRCDQHDQFLIILAHFYINCHVTKYSLRKLVSISYRLAGCCLQVTPTFCLSLELNAY